MKLSFHPYRYYPYERQLALREVRSLLGADLTELTDGVEIAGGSKAAARLVYFSGIQSGSSKTETVQARLERAGAAAKNRQATRYSVHGLHEYKGKFNPQIAKAVLNILGVSAGDRVIDPFCGSGTTLVECSHLRVRSTGVDINPMAVFLANAKMDALRTPAANLEKMLSRIEVAVNRSRRGRRRSQTEARDAYLLGWFHEEIFFDIEELRRCIENVAGDRSAIFLALASNLLRDYSLQDPNDLRIRRRSSPLPDEPFASAFSHAARRFFSCLKQAQSVFGCDLPRGNARLGSIAQSEFRLAGPLHDVALTSPPYAMALPYIDTQRLSLVWLGLIEASRISSLEAELIGSREVRGKARNTLAVRLLENSNQIPTEQHRYCVSLQHKLGPRDGFRRKAVPYLLYRYFSDMKCAFINVRKLVKPGAPFALVVGHNHTVLGGTRFDINTPQHLASIASHCGWEVEEIIELQTYRRFGYHATNAIGAESLVFLRQR